MNARSLLVAAIAGFACAAAEYLRADVSTALDCSTLKGNETGCLDATAAGCSWCRCSAIPSTCTTYAQVRTCIIFEVLFGVLCEMRFAIVLHSASKVTRRRVRIRINVVFTRRHAPHSVSNPFPPQAQKLPQSVFTCGNNTGPITGADCETFASNTTCLTNTGCSW